MFIIIECANLERFIIASVRNQLLMVFVLDVAVLEHLLMCLLELVH